MRLLIRFYRRFISPMTGECCRFYPSCSEYSLEAFERYNFFYALYKSVGRILRCGPWHPGGVDLLQDVKHVDGDGEDHLD